MSANLSRRAILSGIGVVGGVAALGATASPALAAPSARAKSGPNAQSAAHPDAAPSLPPSIASAPEAAVAYQFVGWHDFAAENNSTYGRKYGGNGAYTDVDPDYLAAFVDMPPGALIHDVEFYLANTVAVDLYGITWVTSQGTNAGSFWLQQNHAANAVLHAVKFAIPATLNGPFPFGSRIGVSVPTPTDGSVQINGVRFGLTHTPRSTVLLPAVHRVYSSTAARPLTAGHTVTVPLASYLPVGANGALYTVSVHGLAGHGSIVAGPTGGKLSVPAVQWGHAGDRASNSVTSMVSSTRKITIKSAAGSGDALVQVDLVGYLV
jgi:hypothetical protein